VGREVVAQALQRLVSHCKAPGAILQVMMRELIGPEVQSVDDSSMLLLVRTGETATASRRELPCSIDALPHVRGLIEVRCAEAGLDEAKAGLFGIACVEGFTNIVRHTEGQVEGSKIELLVQRNADQLKVDFVYLGDEVKLPPIREPDFSDYPEGGFGLSIMRQATDELVYDHREGINTISLVKHLTGA
jgi:anti-sigma regulatory factor (Ser/Thr protein kinase)